MLPPGLRFKPTDQELIAYFLYNKVVAQEPLMPPLNDFVPDCNSLFKTGPWVIWDQLGGPNLLKLDQDVYFFTQLEFLRAEREIESGGAWVRSGTEDVEDDEGNIIGLKRHLTYENKGCEHHGEWLLEEYSIPESSQIVLCCLKRGEKASEEFPNQTGKRKRSECQLNLNEREQPSNKVARTELGSSSAALQRPILDDHDVIVIDDDDDDDEEESESPDQFGRNSGLDEWLASLDEPQQHWPLLQDELLLPSDSNYMDFPTDPIGTEQLESPLFAELPDQTAAFDYNHYYWSDSLFMD